MSHEIIRPVDLRLALSHLAQSNYATALSAANLGAGKSYRPTNGVIPKPTVVPTRTGPIAFTGHEWPLEGNELEAFRDLRFPLSFDADSFLVGWALAFILGSVTSVQEGVTGHYTHTIRPSDPLVSGGTLQQKTTSIYYEAFGPDANRYKAIVPSLIFQQVTLSMRRGEPVQLAINLIGSGKEDTATAVTLPALTSEIILESKNVKLEIGNKGAALTDYSDRFREAVFTVTQELNEAGGYTPNAATPADARFRSRLLFLRRTFSLTLALEVARGNALAAGDIQDRVLSRTVSEVKLTQNSNVQAGTGTVNHGFVIRIPSCRLREAPVDFPEGEAVHGISIPEDAVYEDAAITDAPVTVTVENTQASYFS